LKWIEDVKTKGYNDAQIREYLQKQGYKQDVISSLLGSKASSSSTATKMSHKFSKPFLIGIYLGSFIVIVILFVVGLFAIKTINTIYDEEYTKSIDTEFPSGVTAPSAPQNSTVYAVSPVLPGRNNSQPLQNMTRENKVIDALDYCMNNTFYSFLNYLSTSKIASPNIEQTSGEASSNSSSANSNVVSLPSYNIRLPKASIITLLSNYMTTQIKPCMVKKVNLEVRSIQLNISITDNTFFLNATILGSEGVRYSGYRTETPE
jgi:hypothetical protein